MTKGKVQLLRTLDSWSQALNCKAHKWAIFVQSYEWAPWVMISPHWPRPVSICLFYWRHHETHGLWALPTLWLAQMPNMHSGHQGWSLAKLVWTNGWNGWKLPTKKKNWLETFGLWFKKKVKKRIKIGRI